LLRAARQPAFASLSRWRAKGPGGRGWVDEETYDRGYVAQLAALDPQQVWDRLHALAGDHEPVLLCWERPPFTATNRCHRRLVAAWFRATLGHQVDEAPAASVS
jgi:hypothetical protein